MLNDIKKILGLCNTQFDTIINTFIDAAEADLHKAGIAQAKILTSDPLIYSAIVSYVLSMFESYEYREMCANAYAIQKDQLRHYGEYMDV